MPAVEKGHLPPRDAILTGEVSFMEKTDLHPWLNTVVSCSEAGQIQAAVLNTTSEPVPVRRGTLYRTVKLLRAPTEQDQYPWRVATLSKDAEAAVATTTTSPSAAELEEVISSFRLRESPFLQQPDALAQATALLWKHKDTFTHDGSFGRTALLKHRIQTDPLKPPINQRYRPVNPRLEEDLKAQIDNCLLYTSPSPRDKRQSRMPSSA